MTIEQEHRSVGRWGRGPAAFLERFGILIFLVLLIIFFYSQNNRFLSQRNIFNILTEVSIYGVIAVGMTYVVLTAGIDLSVGSVLAFAAMCGAVIAKGASDDRFSSGSDVDTGWAAAMATACMVGLMVGWIHGLATTKLKVPPFVVTLGGMTVWRGATLVLGKGGPISGFDESYRMWGKGELWGVPIPVLVFAIVAIIGHVVLRYTPFGRKVYAVGCNREAARLVGVNTDRVITTVYVIVGLLSGLAGFLLSARLSSAEAVAGEMLELRVIASVVIGGTSLFGGIGGVGGTVVGAILIGVLINGLVIMNVGAYYQQIIIGVIIVLAVAFDTFAKSHHSR